MNFANEIDPPSARPVRARAKIRPKSQPTLPEEIRLALHVSVGDELEFAVQDDGRVTVRGYVSIPSDQLCRYVPRSDQGPGSDDTDH